MLKSSRSCVRHSNADFFGACVEPCFLRLPALDNVSTSSLTARGRYADFTARSSLREIILSTQYYKEFSIIIGRLC
jgi:hypothetical protein